MSNQINQIKGTELIRVATKFGDDILPIVDAFRLMMVSNSCKITVDNYLHKYSTFSVYSRAVVRGTDNRITDEQKKCGVNKLNPKRIKKLSIFDDFNVNDTLMIFALKCSNIRTLCVTCIYRPVQTYICGLQKLENIHLTTCIARTHFYLLLALPNISIIQWIVNRSDPLKVTTLANYHKNTPLYCDMEASHIILCCDHEYKNTVTQKCVYFTTMQTGCDIIHLDKINSYLISR